MAADEKVQSKTFVSLVVYHSHGLFHLFKFLLYLWLQTQKFKVKPLCPAVNLTVMDRFIYLNY